MEAAPEAAQAAAPAAAPAGVIQEATPGSSAGCTMSLDPWLLLEGGADGGSGSGAPPSDTQAPPLPGAPAAAQLQLAPPAWLGGVVKRRCRGLSYVPVPALPAGPVPTIEEQLGGGQAGGEGAAAGEAAAPGKGRLSELDGPVEGTVPDASFGW